VARWQVERERGHQALSEILDRAKRALAAFATPHMTRVDLVHDRVSLLLPAWDDVRMIGLLGKRLGWVDRSLRAATAGLESIEPTEDQERMLLHFRDMRAHPRLEMWQSYGPPYKALEQLRLVIKTAETRLTR
jgi:hypothetical protein